MPMHMLSPADVVKTHPLGCEATYLRLKDGRELVLKGVPRQDRERWRPGQAWTELQVLDILGAAGAPVPKLVAADPQAGWLLLTYLPGQPLGEVLPRLSDASSSLFSALVEGLRTIEGVFSSFASELAPYVADAAPSTWSSMASQMEALLTPCAASAWRALVQDVMEPEALTLGPLDIHAGNAIWYQGQLYFIDFATIGPDFPERRIAAYGQVAWPKAASSLTPEAYGTYSDTAGPKAALRLAVFDLLFWGVVLERLQVMENEPTSPLGARLRAELGDPEPLRKGALVQWRRNRVDDARVATVVAGLR